MSASKSGLKRWDVRDKEGNLVTDISSLKSILRLSTEDETIAWLQTHRNDFNYPCSLETQIKD